MLNEDEPTCMRHTEMFVCMLLLQRIVSDAEEKKSSEAAGAQCSWHLSRNVQGRGYNEPSE